MLGPPVAPKVGMEIPKRRRHERRNVGAYRLQRSSEIDKVANEDLMPVFSTTEEDDHLVSERNKQFTLFCETVCEATIRFGPNLIPKMDGGHVDAQFQIGSQTTPSPADSKASQIRGTPLSHAKTSLCNLDPLKPRAPGPVLRPFVVDLPSMGPNNSKTSPPLLDPREPDIFFSPLSSTRRCTEPLFPTREPIGEPEIMDCTARQTSPHSLANISQETTSWGSSSGVVS
eukprot:TRINITY_DN24753_c0_g1_i1.p1 TRINITY_DN24753_c0_g1~~TRINITY_DN24753_c0_g1_i1.p1  ORF type:complete len:229 (+),score=11.30 TRINITY_DN24753_c0_g1_i1:257-943(+)